MDWLVYFSRYAAVSLSGSPQELAGFYAEGFVAAGPTGAYGALNDDKFQSWLGQVKGFNEQNGMQSMRPVQILEEAAVGPHHRLVTVRWGSRFQATGAGEIEFNITYILHLKGPRIVAYISHEDQHERMRAEGLVS
ncbi:MAG: hypothetical protein KF760_29425 [Candidatus Eremiobacteraeota bacterium]|nr:hypothetical protein [Candidatus Eremiobacteraeota bacterium]MCW5872092.1 hypothetical protein [Candidatus Eremiobacteraeota bacterium]